MIIKRKMYRPDLESCISETKVEKGTLGNEKECRCKKREKKVQIQKLTYRSSHSGSAVMSPTSIHEDVGLIPGLAQWFKNPALP